VHHGPKIPDLSTQLGQFVLEPDAGEALARAAAEDSLWRALA
jgi:hypothetical protein